MSAYPSTPGSYALRAGEVHVWKIPLASTNATVGDRRGILSAAERERATRFIFEKDQARFISCRASLRLLLGRYTGIPPDKIAFRYEPQGKPGIAGAVDWQFNVSHSRDLATIAICHRDPVGIDIELIDPDFPRDETARDILSADELHELGALPPDAQPAHFFQLWTLKEALLKAAGTGLSADPRNISIRLDAALNPAAVTAPIEFSRASLHRFTIEPGYAAAVAILAGITDLAFFSL